MGRITLDKVTKSFGSVHVLHGIDLDIQDGEFVVFVGPSGCGKSTLLRQIAGLDKPNSGEIAIDGKRVNDVPAADRGLAMVFQSYALYPHMSVKQNLAFGLENARMPKAEIENRIAEAARMLEIGDYLHRRPGQLSGGQRQRVAIGRAIVRNPTAFLLDEPLSNLDAELRISMRAELSALHQRLKTTMIYVTHDQVEAMTLANRIVVLRGGRIEQVGTPLELYNRPANRFVAGFIGAPSMNFLPGRITAVSGEGTTVTVLGEETLTVPRTAEDAEGGQEITIGVRPQHIRLAGEGEESITVTIDLIEALGSETVIRARTRTGELLLAVLQGQHALAYGDEVHLTFEAKDLHLFGDDGLRIAGT
ncbi:ABC transporter ATP-binding protein [Roseibium salinum]|uniref:Sn-glycerol-3-phosphate ABC transporter ATP-binding protein UgpC n=1 Tax=Roseibium salinum TaxID=1604349 RepID=A0ABT3QX49_9HYPH|nr:sn-glycerol-3-phosphate ABC transporter ATP-binding protein UgpC [Roseibium sp. DSM 29163]MCX2721506.1 sn-glycerol-3-phosphate ABC transporter ATP-binding protein UgpC [Roseibium sp. DSM 29163]